MNDKDAANADTSRISNSRELLALDDDDGEELRNFLSQSRSPNQDDAVTHAIGDVTSNSPAASPLPLPLIKEDEPFMPASQIAAAFEEMEEGSPTAAAPPLSSASLNPTPPPARPASAREGLETPEDDGDEGALAAQTLLPHEEIEIGLGEFDTMDEDTLQRRRERVRRQQEEIFQKTQHPPSQAVARAPPPPPMDFEKMDEALKREQVRRQQKEIFQKTQHPPTQAAARAPSPNPMDVEKKMDAASLKRRRERVRRQQEEIFQQTQHPPTQAAARAPSPTPMDLEKKMDAASLQRWYGRVRHQEEIFQQTQDPPTPAGIELGKLPVPDEMPPAPAAQTAAAYKEMEQDIRRSIDAPPPLVPDEMPPEPAAQTAAAYKEMEQDMRRSIDAPPPIMLPMLAALTGTTSEDEGEGQTAKKTTQTIEEYDSPPAGDPQEDAQHPSTSASVRVQSLPAIATQREAGATPPHRTQSVMLPIRPPPRSMMPAPHNGDDVRSTSSDPTLQVEAVLYEQDPVVYLGTPVENDIRPWWKKQRIPIAIAMLGLVAGSAVALWATFGVSREPAIASSQPSETQTFLPSLEPSKSSPPSEIPSLRPTFHPSQSAAPSSVRSAPPSTSLAPSTSPSFSPSTPPSASMLPTAFCFEGKINIFTDAHPEETSWTLSRITTEDMPTAKAVREGSPEDESSLHTYEVCLERGEYEFTIYDAFGDGICCDGGAGRFELVLDGWVVLEGGEFGSSQTVAFSLPSASLPPSQSSVPSRSPIPTFRPSTSFGPSSQVPSLDPTLSLRPSPLPSLLPTAPPSTYWSSLTWDQKGQTINGERSGDVSGRTLVLSGDGMTMAVGTLGQSEGSLGQQQSDDRPGHVRVYRWEDDASRWQDLGQKIESTTNGDRFGKGLALSEDGRTLAIGVPGHFGNSNKSGYVRVYQIEEGVFGLIWKQLGQDIEGEGPGDRSGYSVNLSSDGMTLAIGTPFNEGRIIENSAASSLVRIYGWDEDGPSWKQLGQDIEGEGPGDNSGYSVDLSSDGMTVAIGAPLNNGNGQRSGHVRVFRRGDGRSWEQLGQDIDGEASGDLSGSSVSLSADGRTLAIGAKFNDGSGADAGHARVYRIDDAGGEWEQLGQDIDGEDASDGSGELSLSADGKILAIGASVNRGNGQYRYAGHVRIYRMEDGLNWKQVGKDIDGELSVNAGYALSLSADGKTVAIGSPFSSGNGFIKSGHVKVFEVDY